MSLADEKCVPCRGGTPPMEEDKAMALLRELNDGWKLNGEGHLERTYRFKNFRQAMAFASKVGERAEAEGHHPDLYIAWGKCRVEVWTHKIQGLTKSDFVFAAKADRALEELNAQNDGGSI
jgi:4a-hydroxytetrahydrobiopterin dehydratase